MKDMNSSEFESKSERDETVRIREIDRKARIPKLTISMSKYTDYMGNKKNARSKASKKLPSTRRS